MARQSDRRHKGNHASGKSSRNNYGSNASDALGLPMRSLVVLGLFALVILLFVGRLFYVQILDPGGNAEKGEQTRKVTTTLLARRGTIYDRNGNVLATSVEVKSVYVDPTLVSDLEEEVEDIVEVLGGDRNTYCELMTLPDSRYVCLARKIDVDLAKELEARNLDGVYFEDELERYYPYGQTGGQIVGCLDSNGNGYTGLEKQYDDVLAGTDGKVVAQGGVNGAPIPGTVIEQSDPIDGRDIIVTIDIELQSKVEETLIAGAEKNEASGATAVVMDASTGEIYAAASLPLFNPADRTIVEAGATNLKVVTDAFEPGSVFKTVAATAVLESGTMTPDTEIDCPAYIEADEYEVSDAHERDDTVYTLREVIAVSSNVGISLAVEEMGFTKFYEYLQQYQLNRVTGVDYPDESAGFLAPVTSWSRIQCYNVTFGQGVSVTPLQVARFYCALVNDGVAVTPHFLAMIPQDGDSPTYDEVAITTNMGALSDMKSMLESVVEDGTGKQAAIDGYTVAGKTSTAEIAAPEGGYRDDVYNLAFCGFLAGSSSDLVCFVGANEVAYDTNVCPMFKDIMSFAIERYKISPN